MNQNTINDLQIYLRIIGEYELLKEDEEKELFRKLKNGDESVREKIINSNLKLVVSIAKKYKGMGISFADLIQEGAFGLMSAVDKFDVELGYKFSTYATYWIKQSITKAIVNKSRAIRLPAHINDRLSKARKAERELCIELGRQPSNAEIAARLQTTESDIKDLFEMSQAAISLDTPVGDDGDAVMSDFVEDTHFESPTAAVARVDLKEQLLKVMDSLDPREKEVLIKRYGMETNEPMTLEEVGNAMGLSRERIRQIEEKALRKMRNPIRSDQLKIYMAELGA